MNLQKLVSDCLARHRSNSEHRKVETPMHDRAHSKMEKIGINNSSRSMGLSQKNVKNFTSVNSQYVSGDRSFQPETHQLPRSLYKATNKTECSRQQIIQRLLNDRRQRQNQLNQLKHQKQQASFSNLCTFRPEINSKSKKLVMKTQCTERCYESVDAFQRLYQDGVNKIKLSQTLLNHDTSQHNKQNQKNQNNCLFQPQTNYRKILNSQTLQKKPLYQRIDQILQQKRNHQRQLTKKTLQQNYQLQQKPKISQNSVNILQDKQLFKKNILSRISIYTDEQLLRKKQREKIKQQLQVQKCTFQPNINPSAIILPDFNVRQQNYLEKLNQKITSRICLEKENNFKPAINKISEMLVLQERGNQDFQDKINRIASENIRKKLKISQIQQEVYKQCTFEPQINIISKCLGESQRRPDQINYHNHSQNNARHCCENMLEKQEQYEFKPKINKISEHLVKMKRQNSSWQPGPQTKRSTIDHLKMQMQYKQLSQCTFKPQTYSTRSKSQRLKNYSHSVNNVVAGFDGYQKKINKINYKKELQKKRQDQIFNLHKKYQPRKATKAQQFHLSQGYDHKAAIKQQAEKNFEKQCPFKPKINHKR